MMTNFDTDEPTSFLDAQIRTPLTPQTCMLTDLDK